MRIRLSPVETYIHETAEGSFIVVPHSELDIEIVDVDANTPPEVIEANKRAEQTYAENSFFVGRIHQGKIEFNLSGSIELAFWTLNKIRPCAAKDFELVKTMRDAIASQFKLIKAAMINIEKTVMKKACDLSRTVRMFKAGDVLALLDHTDNGFVVRETPSFIVIAKGGYVIYESEGSMIESDVEFMQFVYESGRYKLYGDRKFSSSSNIPSFHNIATLSPEDAAKFQNALSQVKQNNLNTQNVIARMETAISDRAKEEVALIEE